jgi:hypothetical protein
VSTVSPDVVEQIERGFECWNRREINEMMEMYTRDAEVDVSRLLPDESVLRGHDEIRAYYDRMWETWSGFGWKPHELEDGLVAKALFEPGRSPQLQG